METENTKLKTDFRNACNAYLRLFAEKHGFDWNDCDWVSEDAGGVACLGDFFVDMNVIKDDIDMNAPKEEFFRWYDYSTEVEFLDLPKRCNYRSWLKGCPRYSETTFGRIRQLRDKLNESRMKLLEAIEQESEWFGKERDFCEQPPY